MCQPKKTRFDQSKEGSEGKIAMNHSLNSVIIEIRKLIFPIWKKKINRIANSIKTKRK